MTKRLKGTYLLVFFLELSTIVYGQQKSVENPFYGSFEQHKIFWFQENELKLKSVSSDDTTIYAFRNYPVGSKKYFRTQGEFKIHPTVEYAYNKNSNNTTEIYYEWDGYTQIDGKQRNVDTAINREDFVKEYTALYNAIRSKIGDSQREGDFLVKKNGSLEITDTWTNDKFTCILSIYYSDIGEDRAAYSIIPTHRIYCQIEWTNH